jgi:PPK2 family polyphosphate:nucleotide phosphotransferase
LNAPARDLQAGIVAATAVMYLRILVVVGLFNLQLALVRHPSAEELEHDFLWRTTRCLPERGRIGIFNRSYYEEVLIVRVHPQILQAEHVPMDSSSGQDFWRRRFRSIVDLEAHLHDNGTRIVKFFLHISPQEQCKRLLERIDDPRKNWKLSAADVQERSFWDEYMHAYAECLAATSTQHAPWYAIPADDKKNARLIISKVLHETLRELKMSYPKADTRQRRELKKVRSLLTRSSRTPHRA